ncbi:MAG TPA: hypothetical protein DCM87_04875 [Planctomycetes bacterium]|nr:hypothetical protein [Planctomycetota bacterium]
MALHRLSAWGAEADAILLGASIVILWIAGVVMCAGTYGTVFAPAEKRWGCFAGFIEPLVTLWRPLAEDDAVELKVEAQAASGAAAYELAIAGSKRRALGVTSDAFVAVSCAESLATFLARPLVVNDGEASRRIERGPFWGQLAAMLEREGGSKRKATGSEFRLPWRLFPIRGRGPVLLAAFMVVVVGLNWESLALLRSAWGVAAAAVLAALCAWALPFGLNEFAKRGVVRADKDGLVIEEIGLRRTRRVFAWNAIAYCAVLPAAKGFLGLAGRESRVVVGDERRSAAIGATLKENDIPELYRFLIQQIRKYAR